MTDVAGLIRELGLWADQIRVCIDNDAPLTMSQMIVIRTRLIEAAGALDAMPVMPSVLPSNCVPIRRA